MNIRKITRVYLCAFPLILGGCAGSTPETSLNIQQQPLESNAQLVGGWVVSAIGERKTSGRYSPRLAFGADDRIGGIAGCNRFLGNYRFSSDGTLNIGKIKVTHRLCPAAVMVQEALFLSRLRSVQKSALSSSGELLIYSGQYKTPIRLRPAQNDVSKAGRPQYSADG